MVACHRFDQQRGDSDPLLPHSRHQYLVAAGVQAVAGFAQDGRIAVGDTGTKLALLGLILFPTVGGHTLAIYLLRHVKSQMVTLSIPAQFVLGTTAAAFLFGEKPSVWLIGGAVMVLGGVVLGVQKSGDASPPPAGS